MGNKLELNKQNSRLIPTDNENIEEWLLHRAKFRMAILKLILFASILKMDEIFRYHCKILSPSWK